MHTRTNRILTTLLPAHVQNETQQLRNGYYCSSVCNVRQLITTSKFGKVNCL